MRIAYADPPYPGCAKLYPEQTEVDHRALIARLMDEFPDGWALSSGGGRAWHSVLAMCPPDIRVGAWVKTFVSLRRSPGAAYAWEPVLWRGGRQRQSIVPIFDWVRCAPPMKTRAAAGYPGAKPEQFCYWLFGVLGMEAGDELVDLFPGTGAVTRAWETWKRQGVLPLGPTPRLQMKLPA
jgi:hypothetical protein